MLFAAAFLLEKIRWGDIAFFKIKTDFVHSYQCLIL